VAEVAEVLRNVDPNKACGPDGISNRLLRNVADEIAPSLRRLFNLSLSLGIMPANWKIANITATTISSNYRPTSLLSTVSKAQQLYQLQQGFLKGRSTTTQLSEAYHDILNSLPAAKRLTLSTSTCLKPLTRYQTICCCLS